MSQTFLIGINHQTADVSLRERLYIQKRELEVALSDIKALDGVEEVMILSTCNRLEIFCVAKSIEGVKAWLARTRYLSDETLDAHCYVHTQEAAIEHLIRVGCGLNSMFTGETQIFGQLKSAFAHAQSAEQTGDQLNALMPAIFAAVKHIRTDSHIGEHAISFGHLISKLAKSLFDDVSSCQVLLIGSGEMIETVATYLSALSTQPLTIANRTLSRALQLAHQYGGRAIPLSDLGHHLTKAAIVVCATSTTLPLIGKGLVEGVMAKRHGQPLLMIDLAVPRDIEPEVGKLPGIHLHNLDKMNAMRQSNAQRRDAAAAQAQAMIPEAVHTVQKALKPLACTNILKQYRHQGRRLVQAELDAAKLDLAGGKDPECVLEQLAHRLTQKLMHTPSSTLGSIDPDQDTDFARLAQHLLLPESH